MARTRGGKPVQRCASRNWGLSVELLEDRWFLSTVTVQLSPSKDNTLFENAAGTVSNGAGQHFLVGSTNSGSVRRALIAFDIESANIPTGATITDVALQLHMSRTRASNQTISLHRLTRIWGEGTSDAAGNEGRGTDATTNDATWVHTFFNTTQWSRLGGDFQPVSSATAIVGGVADYIWSSANMVQDVQDWLTDSNSNFGWILIGNESANRSTKRFDSGENSNVDFRPALSISYELLNTDPTVSDIGDQSTDEDISIALNFTVGDLESAPETLMIAATSDNQTLAPNANIEIGGSGAARTVTITPAANQFGSTTITVTVQDDDGGVVMDTFVLNVTSVNDNPIISDIANQSTDEDTPTGAIAFTVGDVETTADSLTVTATSDNQTLVPAAGLVISGNNADRTVVISPAPNQFGAATILATVEDEMGASASASFILDVRLVNDAPTISSIPDQLTQEDLPTAPIIFTISDIETDAESLRLSATSSDTTLVPTENILVGGVGVNRNVTIIAADNDSGVATITVSVEDEDGGMAAESFTLTVEPVNDPPQFTSGDSVSVPENSQAVLTVTVSDPEGDMSSFAISGGRDQAALAIDAGTGELTFSSAPDFENPEDSDSDNVYEVEVRIDDGNGEGASQLIHITVTDVDEIRPSVDISPVSPNPRAGAVDEITIAFSKAVTGFDLRDLVLTRRANDTLDALPGAATLVTSDDITWTLGNLSELTAKSGVYELTLIAEGSGVQDLTGNALVEDGAQKWVNGAGDANLNNAFDQFDIIAALQEGKYLTGELANWGQGDWNGDGVFDQFDIITAQQTQPPHYRQGPFVAT